MSPRLVGVRNDEKLKAATSRLHMMGAIHCFSNSQNVLSSIIKVLALASDLREQSCGCLSFVVLSKPIRPSAFACSTTRSPASLVLMYRTVGCCTALHANALHANALLYYNVVLPYCTVVHYKYE